MAYFVRRKIPYILGIGLLQYRNTEKEIFQNETGSERLYKMFTLDDYGNQSREVHSISQITGVSFVVGSMYGGLVAVQKATEEFLETNQGTKFSSEFDARRKYNHVRSIAFLRGAVRLGWRMAVFTFSFVLIITTISVYRDKTTPWEYSIAGFITGAIYKTSLGPKGMLVGATVGGVLGTIAGLCTVLVLKLSGITMQDVRYQQYAWKEYKNKVARDASKKYQNEHEMKEIVQFHDTLIQEKDEEQNQQKEETNRPSQGESVKDKV